MNVKNSSILILGGWGLVGSAIAKKLVALDPKKLIISSLKKEESEDAVKMLREEFSNVDPELFVPEWGNIFTREVWKDDNPSEIINNPEKRRMFIRDIFQELDPKVKISSALYNLINRHKPNLVIDCINTATAIAYLDIYTSSLNVLNDLDLGDLDPGAVENLMASNYVPQLIRHIQILGESLNNASTDMYIKVGTSGTGGMGLNIPYTHSEERPSRVLMSKTAVAGAHSLLMYLMARTPNGPIVKEIKPTATIAWKKIVYDTVKKGGSPVRLYDMDPSQAKKVDGVFEISDEDPVNDTGEDLKSVYIDTGENGIFSKGEFQTITTLGQMEIVTPEEIADYVIFEAQGGNTGKDVMQGLDAFTLGPSYRGGFLRNTAMKKLEELEAENETEGVAFELLGPPRLSKLLYEAHILKSVCNTFKNVVELDKDDITEKAVSFIKTNSKLRAQILSIGIPILLDNNNYLIGKSAKIPVNRPWEDLEMTKVNIDKWTYAGWIDLRSENIQKWQDRFTRIMSEIDDIKYDLTGSRNMYGKDYWNNFEKIEEGKLAAWIFEREDEGWRFKR